MTLVSADYIFVTVAANWLASGPDDDDDDDDRLSDRFLHFQLSSIGSTNIPA